MISLQKPLRPAFIINCGEFEFIPMIRGCFQKLDCSNILATYGVYLKESDQEWMKSILYLEPYTL